MTARWSLDFKYGNCLKNTNWQISTRGFKILRQNSLSAEIIYKYQIDRKEACVLLGKIYKELTKLYAIPESELIGMALQ